MNTRKAGLSSEFMCVISGQLTEICKIINKSQKYNFLLLFFLPLVYFCYRKKLHKIMYLSSASFFTFISLHECYLPSSQNIFVLVVSSFQIKLILFRRIFPGLSQWRLTTVSCEF